MQTVYEFMLEYFDERYARLHAFGASRKNFVERWFTAEYLARECRFWETNLAFERKHPPAVLEIEELEEAAKVMTTEPLAGELYRYTYHLKKTSIGWQIDRRARECYRCKGKGIESGVACYYCKGTGWKYHGETKR